LPLAAAIWFFLAACDVSARDVQLSIQPIQAQRGEAKPDAAPADPDAQMPPYEPQLLRLAEILGALSYLRDICGTKDGETWRARMNALLEAEARTNARRERLAGAFNRGLRGYSLTYRVCTPNAQAIISRFLDEGSRIAREVANRYGPT